MKFARVSVLAPWLFALACSGKEAPTSDTGLPAGSASTPTTDGTESGASSVVAPGQTGPNPPTSTPNQTPVVSPNQTGGVNPPPGAGGVSPVNPPANGGGPGVVNPPPDGTPAPVNPPSNVGGFTGDMPGDPVASGGGPVVPAGGQGGGPVEPVTPVDEPPPLRPSLVTSAQGSYWQVGEATEMAGGSPTFSVDENATQQEWLGFGGTFNEAGWDVLLLLDAAERERAIRLLFSPSEGANFAWGRFPLGPSDYAMDRYSLSEANDFTMENFSIERDKELLIPYIQAALAVKPGLRLWASPWSPPAWMKADGDINGGRINSDPEVLEAYALYFARFVEDYEAEGVDIEQVMPQNEPGYETNYPSCLWTPELLRDFVRDYLGPTFTERGVGADIWMGTMSAPEDTQHISTMMADANAAQYVKGFGLQWNTMGSTGGLVQSHGLPVMQTEHKCGNYRFMPETYNSTRPPNDHAYAVESWGLIRDWLKAGVSAYSAWNMVLDTQGENLDGWLQNSLLIVDRDAKTSIETPAYYVFRHLSYFVDPGAMRVSTSGNTDALAFKNPDGSIATIVFNSQGQAQQMSVGVGGTTLQFEVPGNGWASVFWAAE